MKKLNIIIFIIVSLVISITVSVIFMLNISSIIESKTRANVSESTKESGRFLDSYVSTYIAEVDNFIGNDSSATPSQRVNNLYTNYQDVFIAFGVRGEENAITSYEGTYDNDEIAFKFNQIREERLFGERVVLTQASTIIDGADNKMVIFYNFGNYFGLQAFTTFENMLGSAYEGGTHFVFAASDGFIIANTYNDSFSLSGLFDRSIANVGDFAKSIQDQDDGIITTTLSGKTYLVSAKQVLDGIVETPVYMFVFVEGTYVNDFARSLLIISVIYVFFFVLANTGLALTIFFTKRAKKDLIIPFSYDNQYVLLVSENGRVISKNKRFASSKYNCANLMRYEIAELVEQSEEAFKELLEGGSTVTIKYTSDDSESAKVENVTFLIIKSAIGYQLIGEPVEQGDSSKEVKKYSGAGIDLDYVYKDDYYDTFNRKALLSKLDEAIKNNKKYETTYGFICSLNNRREIERLFGARTMELVNVQIIDRLKNILDTKDLYAYSNDFFVFFRILKDDFNALAQLMQKINAEFKNPIRVYKDELSCEIFFGIYPLRLIPHSLEPTPKGVVEKMLTAYDRARVSKTSNYYLYDVNSETLVEREEQVANDIKIAIENGEFITNYQPIYNLKEDRVSGFECLLRWDNDKYRYESPFEYVRVAERSGFIHDIGTLTFRQALETIKNIGRDDIRISVNVSAAQFMQQGLISDILGLFKEYDVPFQCIAIEITETLFIDSMQEVIDKLSYIRSFGIKVYLDDFGTEYSSLLYLAELPVDVIKIDKEFTKQIGSSKNVRSIIRHLIEIADDLDIQIVAEGVETEAQLRFLERYGCDYIQGYYFSKPVGRNEVIKALDIKREGGKKWWFLPENQVVVILSLRL